MKPVTSPGAISSMSIMRSSFREGLNRLQIRDDHDKFPLPLRSIDNPAADDDALTPHERSRVFCGQKFFQTQGLCQSEVSPTLSQKRRKDGAPSGVSRRLICSSPERDERPASEIPTRVFAHL